MAYHHPEPSMMITWFCHPSTYIWWSRYTGMSFLGLAETEDSRMEKTHQFEFLPWRGVSDFKIESNTVTDTYLTMQVSATIHPAMSPCISLGNGNLHFAMVCQGEVNISMEKHLQFRFRQTPWHMYVGTYHHTTGYELLHLNEGWWSTPPRHLMSRRPCHHWGGSTIPTLTPIPMTQSIIQIERLHMEINEALSGLCVTFRGVVDWKSKELKPTA